MKKTIALLHINTTNTTPYQLNNSIDYTVAKIASKIREELLAGRTLDYISVHISTLDDEEFNS